MNLLIIFCLAIAVASIQSDTVTDPSIIYWKTTTGYGKGYGASFLNNVYKIEYSSNYVFTSSNSIPAYSIGPWTNNPNDASAMAYIFKFPRSPSEASTKSKVLLGHIGLWLDGVTMFNPKDGNSYNDLGVWNQNAYYFEYSSFDSCNGHPDGNGQYHAHVNPTCLYTTANSSYHSPLLGFAFDGFPVYGPYGYSSANDSTSSIKLMVSSYVTRSITDRTTLSNGTTLTSTYYGPSINSKYPLGSYVEDYEYSSGYGDLDLYNGRYCATPEYPSGTYAYFVTVNSNYVPQYPYILGTYYYGSPVAVNLVGSSVSSISVSTTVYYSYS